MSSSCESVKTATHCCCGLLGGGCWWLPHFYRLSFISPFQLLTLFTHKLLLCGCLVFPSPAPRGSYHTHTGSPCPFLFLFLSSCLLCCHLLLSGMCNKLCLDIFFSCDCVSSTADVWIRLAVNLETIRTSVVTLHQSREFTSTRAKFDLY